MIRPSLLAFLVIASLAYAPNARAEARNFAAGSLVVPMDLAYQDSGAFQAYGLVYQLLRQGVTVYWVIDLAKTWHAAPCDTENDECAWDCAEEGSGVKCTYPTASPDFYVGATVLWDSDMAARVGTTITSHGYRGGPFVVDAADAAQARAIIDVWNDQSTWAANPWADRSVFNVVSVHQTTESFTGNVVKEMVQPPTIAVFADGREEIAQGYLLAAGIPQSNGNEFPGDKCDAVPCGPGTVNPDLLSVPSIMGDMGTCDAPNRDHSNGALFNADGTPAYCQIMSMHWDVSARETVECDGGACPATQEDCNGETFTYHGHEVVAEVRSFLSYPTHFFAECQAVNAYENQVPNPEWPYLDDDLRIGHFLTTVGLPDCPCDSPEGDFECIVGGCDGGTRDCCMPRDDKEAGAGFLIGPQPNNNDVEVLSPGIPYNQFDGNFATVGGSEASYTLSSFLGVTYKNDLEVTFLTGRDGPGTEDIWMTGFVDGECDIISHFEGGGGSGNCARGKVSYLGGHRYQTDTPISRNPDSQGTRLFLNALFEADCVTGALMPQVGLVWQGDQVLPESLPTEANVSLVYSNTGDQPADNATLTITLPAGVTLVSTTPAATVDGQTLTWDLGSLASGSSGTVSLTLGFATEGNYQVQATLAYGSTDIQRSTDIRVAIDSDGDGRANANDAFPNDPTRCGDSDADTCDDCASGTFDVANDCPAGGDAGPGAGGGGGGGCGCRVAPGTELPVQALLALGFVALLLRRRRRD